MILTMLIELCHQFFSFCTDCKNGHLNIISGIANDLDTI